jgi:hypothetical protein
MNAQDAWGRLVEDVRLGLIRKMILRRNPNRVEYHPIKLDVVLDNLPVFSFGVLDSKPSQIHVDALDAVLDGRFHLPYPRLAAIYRAVPTPESQLQLPASHRSLTPRWYVYVLDQLDDHGFLVSSFTRHDDQPRWAFNTWQAEVNSRATTLSFDKEGMRGADPEFFDVVEEAARNRLTFLETDLYRLTTSGTGRTVPGAGGEVSRLADKRRQRDGLSPVSPIRIITFDEMPPRKSAVATGTGSSKAAHWRRGTWRTLPDGRETWVKSSAVHGGGGAPPPWYELHQTPRHDGLAPVANA